MRFFLNGNDLESVARDLNVGLHSLSLSDNFQGFFWEGELEAGEEIQIVNELRSQSGEKLTPTSVIIHLVEGPPTVSPSDTEWDSDYAYLINRATTSTCSVKAFFFR
jgi:hypothetical protein